MQLVNYNLFADIFGITFSLINMIIAVLGSDVPCQRGLVIKAHGTESARIAALACVRHHVLFNALFVEKLLATHGAFHFLDN